MHHAGSWCFQGCQGERTTVFSAADLHFIRTLHTVCSPNILLCLAHSLCPTILGLPHVKLALTLALLGGSCPPACASGAACGSTVRSNIHVLLIGDPGLGKSQLLHACVAASPRGMYVCSNTSTTAGLTLSVSKDAVTNEMAFTAGALVLADGGVCCLDELDNMRGEHKTLLEVMEQQEVRSGSVPSPWRLDCPNTIKWCQGPRATTASTGACTASGSSSHK